MQQSNSVINCASGLTYDTVTTGAEELYQQMRAASPYFTKDLTVEDLQTPADCGKYMPEIDATHTRVYGDGSDFGGSR